MAKKQTRRSISVSRSTYERLKAFCETQGISMSQFVENRVGDFLSTSDDGPVTFTPPPRPAAPPAPRPQPQPHSPLQASRTTVASTLRAEPPRHAPMPMTSAAARFAVEPPPPIIKPRPEPTDVKPPTAPTADQIFTF